MYDCLVVVKDLEQGVYQEWRGTRTAIRGLDNIPEVNDPELFSTKELIRKLPIWACMQKDVGAVVEQLSQEWVGYEIKIFNLTQIVTRLVGDLRTKEVSKDGVLPV